MTMAWKSGEFLSQVKTHSPKHLGLCHLSVATEIMILLKTLGPQRAAEVTKQNAVLILGSWRSKKTKKTM